MKQCLHKIESVKVPQGNAFRLLMPFKTARWENNELVPDNIDIRYLTDVTITIDGEPWTDYEMDERGPIVQIGAEDFNELGAYNAVIEATYAGVAIRGAYYECFTRVEWSFESNVELHLPDSPLVAETSYVYIGITDDQELEALKQQYRNAIATCETARLQYEAAKEAYDEKAEALDDVAKQSSLLSGFAATLEAIAGIHVDIPDNIATRQDVQTATEAILAALAQIQPDDPYSRALATFFGITDAYNPQLVPITEQEIIDELSQIWEDEFGTPADPLPAES